MTRALLLLLASSVLALGCAARRPPLVERWTVVLVDQGGFTVVHAQTMAAPLHPALSYSDCPGPSRLVVVAQRTCSGLDARRRVFLLFYTDTARRTALYREEGAWSSD